MDFWQRKLEIQLEKYICPLLFWADEGGPGLRDGTYNWQRNWFIGTYNHCARSDSILDFGDWGDLSFFVRFSDERRDGERTCASWIEGKGKRGKVWKIKQLFVWWKHRI